MTLRELFTVLERYAASVPDIRTTVENNVTKLNEMRAVEYGVFAITQGEHTSREGWTAYSLNLFYIDRLVNGQDNELEIQSHAIEVLKGILKMAGEGGIDVGEARFTAFTDRFQDLCAGAYAAAVFTVPESDCVEL